MAKLSFISEYAVKLFYSTVSDILMQFDTNGPAFTQLYLHRRAELATLPEVGVHLHTHTVSQAR
jgi:hypothetical protein